MRKDIHEYVESCDSCQRRGGTHPTEPLNPIKVGQSFDRVDTTKHTPFDLTYGRMATLPISFTVETYPAQLINENNFQETLQQRAYTLLSTLEGKQRIAATHIEHSQAQQKEQHDDKLPSSGKFENKWDGPFFIHEVLGNGSYKLRLDDKILAKVAHRDRLKHYHSRNNSEPLIPQIGTHSPLVSPEDIPRNLEPIVVIEQSSNLNT
ncbi:hypothetical protein G9A89_001412 [Geosiphon pyriformis]|nr:hypothetical protein G9A89_001412 [Geosiphon pyriformis]